MLRAVVAEGNAYARMPPFPRGLRVRFDAARALGRGDGSEGLVVALTVTDASGRERALEYPIAGDDSLLQELAAGEEDAEGFGLIVAVNVVEEVTIFGIDSALAKGTLRDARRRHESPDQH